MSHSLILLIQILSLVGALLYFTAAALLAGVYRLILRREKTLPRRTLIRFLELLVLFGPLKIVVYRVPALYKLVVLHTQERNYQRALDYSDQMEGDPVSEVIGAEIRRRRAECLDALGRSEEAKQEIQQAWTALKTRPMDRPSLSAQAGLLSREGRYKEAYETYKQLLAITPAGARSERDQALIFLATKASQCGENDAHLLWAQQLLAESKSPRYLCMAYRLAGVGASNQRNLDLAEEYCRKGIALAEAHHRPDDVAQTSAYYATVLGRRADVDASMALLDKIIAGHPEKIRTAWSHKAELLLMLGRFDEGIAAVDRAIASNPGVIPSVERHFVALINLIAARGYAMLGNAAESRRIIAESAAVLTDPKLALWCRAMHLYCTALDGDLPATRLTAAAVLDQVAQFPESNDLRMTVYSNICRAAWKLGDWDALRYNLGEYETLYLSPSETAMPLFLRGECARAAGDEPAAHGLYRQAAAVHPHLYWSMLAERVLAGT